MRQFAPLLTASPACVAGACIVCVDIFIRLLPGKKNFNIQDSSAFLSSSLSLSFGVMVSLPSTFLTVLYICITSATP